MTRDRSGSNDPRPADAPQRVQRLIAAAGICSRREAEKLIEEGRVTVNEETITLGASARMVDRIAVNGVMLDFPKPVYFMFNKPEGVVTAMRDKNARIVTEFIVTDERIYPVGRLDKDTTGLIFLTNDGAFATRVAHPRYEIEKTYVATLDRVFDRKDTNKLVRGIPFREGLANAKVRLISPRKVEVTIHQGYNHIVKRMFGAIGYRVKDLARTRIGPIPLTIPIGAYRPMTQKEVEAVLAATKHSSPSRVPYVTRDEVEAARRRSREIKERRAPPKTTWEPRRPSKGGFYPDRPKPPRISRDERAAIRDANAARSEKQKNRRGSQYSSSSSAGPARTTSSKRPSFSRKKRS